MTFIHSLDLSWFTFPHQLNETLQVQIYEECVKSLEDDDLKWLVDFLDKVPVNHLPAPFPAINFDLVC